MGSLENGISSSLLMLGGGLIVEESQLIIQLERTIK